MRADRPGHGPLLLGGVAVGLFLVWSNSFVAIGYLLGREGAAARFDWIGLTVARFVTALPLCAAWCLGWRRRRFLDLLRRHPLRLAVGGLLAVPGYNLALYWGQQHGVPAPVASLTTALLPLFVLLLAAAFLGEAISRPRAVGFLVSLAGMAVIASAGRADAAGPGYAVSVAVTALAPLSWATFSVLSKPLAGRAHPLDWTYGAVLIGTLPLLAVLPFRGGPEMLALDLVGWAAILFLSLLCTVLGFALWVWLLNHLPASTVGLTVFLNPPLTTLSKLVLAFLLPAAFSFVVTPREWLGGALALVGLAVAVVRRTGPARRH